LGFEVPELLGWPVCLAAAFALERHDQSNLFFPFCLVEAENTKNMCIFKEKHEIEGLMLLLVFSIISDCILLHLGDKFKALTTSTGFSFSPSL